MQPAYIILSLAITASAQYAITDLIGKDNGASSDAPSTRAGANTPFQATGPHSGTGPHSATSLTGETGNMAANPMAPNPLMSMLSGSAAGGGELSQDSMAVVSGLVEAFMHKVQLEPGERSCLENNMRQASGDIVGTVGDVVTTVKAVMAGNGTVHKKGAGPVVSAGFDALIKIGSLVSSSMQFMKNCVHGDALAFLNTTAHHLIDGKYLEHHFIVNGVDIAHYMADSVVSFESHNFRRFGSDIGMSLRKVLLSNATNGTRLPEGMPEEKVIQEATDGLMRGFFARGSGLIITDKEHRDVDIEIDLHECIAGNSVFWKELWLTAWNLIAQLAMNGKQHGLGTQPTHGQPKWEGELMSALLELPTALSNCGVAQEFQTMFSEAIQSLNAVHVQFLFPHGRFHGSTAADEMAKAVEAWTNWNFEKFGYELGNLLRKLVMLALPQKYSVHASGKLQRYAEDRAKSSHADGTASFSALMIGSGIVSLLVALAVVRMRRSSPLMAVGSEVFMSDAENGADTSIE